MSDLKIAVEALQAKQANQTALFNYYVGDQPLRYAAERLRDIFQNQQTSFVQNWCAVVVDACLDRLVLPAFDVAGSESESQRLNDLWNYTRLSADANAVMRAALVTGEAYVLAWLGDDGVEAYYNDPRLCNVWYEADNPRKKRMGAKWWRGDDEVWKLNLYYPDRIEHYLGKKADEPTATSFTLESDEPNPWGIVPLFHFYRDRWIQGSELTNVLPLQDAINKLLGDMMIAAEFGAFRQRWIITNADTSQLRNAPNEIWELPAAMQGEQPVSAGEFSATDLGNYLDAIDRMATSIAVITRTPKHYLFQSPGTPPSGEALIAMEAPLNRKASQYQNTFGLAWSECAAFMLTLDGAAVDPMTVVPMWEKVETVQPRTEAEIRNMGVQAGIPLVTLLRDEGWTDEEIADMEADKESERQSQETFAAASLERMQTNFDAGNDDVTPVTANGANGAV